MNKFSVVRDNREKPGHGWTFRSSKYCNGTVPGTLKTADYTVLGLENVVALERKASVSEIVMNLGEARFEAELVRLAEFKYPYILLEFDLEDVVNWPRGSGLPRSVQARIKTSGAYVLKRITELMLKYPRINWIFCGTEGQALALSILKTAYRLETA